MKAICHKSGISFTVPQFRCTLPLRGRAVHPVFLLPQPQLFQTLKEFVRGNLTEEESVLLFLALADSSGKVIWHEPFQMTEDAPGLIAQHMTGLAGSISRLQEIQHPKFEVPMYVMSARGEANTIGGLLNMLSVWDESIAEFATSHVEAARAANLMRLEEGLERLVRIAKNKPATYAKAISRWAATAGEFPQVVAATAEGQINLSLYWQSLIVRCITKDKVHQIDMDDLIVLIEHCELLIPHGTIHAASLMENLRDGLRAKREFLGVPSVSGVKVFSILPRNAEEEVSFNRESELLATMAATAPTEVPTREQFGNAILYLRAMSKYRAAQSLKANPEAPKVWLGSPNDTDTEV